MGDTSSMWISIADSTAAANGRHYSRKVDFLRERVIFFLLVFMLIISGNDKAHGLVSTCFSTILDMN